MAAVDCSPYKTAPSSKLVTIREPRPRDIVEVTDSLERPTPESTGLPGEQVAYALIVASYRRRMGVIAVREMARHRLGTDTASRSSRASPASSLTRWGGSGRCSSRGGGGRRRWRRGRWRSRRRWFPWRVRSRVGVAEGVWREGCVCACEREVCLGCVRVLLFCV